MEQRTHSNGHTVGIHGITCITKRLSEGCRSFCAFLLFMRPLQPRAGEKEGGSGKCIMQREEERRIRRGVVRKCCAPCEMKNHRIGVRGGSRHVTLAMFVGMSFLLCAAAWTSKEQEGVLDFYKKFDVDGNLHIDLGEYAASGGKVVPDANLEDWFRDHDVDKDGLLSMGEIASGLFKNFEASDPEEELARIRKYGGNPPNFQAPPPSRREQEDGEEDDDEGDDQGGTAEGGNRKGRSASTEKRMRSLFDIVRDGTVSELRGAIEKSSSVDLHLNDGECTPLHQALELFDGWLMHSHMMPKSNRTDFVNKALLLIEHGADLRHGCFGSFSLTMAVQTRNIRVTKKILELLSMVSSNGRVDAGTVDWHGPRHDLQPGGGTSLHGAVSTNAFTIGVSKILVGHAGAGPGVQEMIKKGYRHVSVVPKAELKKVHNSFAVWGLTIPASVMMYQGTSYDGEEFRDAIFEWNSQLTKMLLDSGASPAEVDENGNTPLHIAALAGDAHSASLLIDRGAPLDIANNLGMTPLEAAVRGGRSKVIQLVLEAVEKAGMSAEASRVRGASGERRAVEEGEREERPGRGGDGGGGANVCPAPRGGWKEGCYEDMEIDFCDITQVNATDRDVYSRVDEHLRLGRPLMIRGAIGDKDWISVMGLWTRGEMTEEFGSQNFKVFEQHGGEKVSTDMTLSEYLKWMDSHDASDDTSPPNWLVDTQVDVGHPLVDSHDTIVKRFVGELYDSDSNRVSNYQFMVAPARAGASPHFHYTSARLMTYGRARWFLWPPTRAFYTGKPVSEWFKQDYPRMTGPNRPFECLQGPGDLIIVPPMWGHGVMYLDDTAGMATLFMA